MVEVCYGTAKVVVGLIVSVVPVPVVTAKVTPASVFVADAAFPTRIKVTTTDVDVTGRTVLYHYMGASGYYMGAQKTAKQPFLPQRTQRNAKSNRKNWS